MSETEPKPEQVADVATENGETPVENDQKVSPAPATETKAEDKQPEDAKTDNTTKETESIEGSKDDESKKRSLGQPKPKKRRRRQYDDDVPKEKEEEDEDDEENEENDDVVDEDEEEDDLLEIDQSNIITTGRRTRGKVIDFVKAAEKLDKEQGTIAEEDEEEGEFKE